MTTLPSYTQSSFVIKNTSNKNVDILGMRIRPGRKVDLFTVLPGLTEAAVIEATRVPNGDIYKEAVVKGTISIKRSRMATFTYNTAGSFDTLSTTGTVRERLQYLRANIRRTNV